MSFLNMPYCIFLFIMLFCLSNKSTGQQKQEHADFIGFNPAAGFIVPHSRDVVDVSGAVPFGAEVEAGRWFLRKYDGSLGDVSMKGGLALTYMYYDVPDVLGSSASISAFAEPVLNESGWLHVSLRAGVGLSYHSNVYDEIQNPRNLFISSPLSFLTHFDVLLTRHISEKWYITAYAKYNHISNIGISEPNKGLNYPVFGIGSGYAFQPIQYAQPSGDAGLRPWRLCMSGFATLHKISESDAYKDAKPALGIILETRKPLSRINGISLGVEAGANYQLKQELAQQNESTDHKIIALLAGHDFYTGRFVFSQYLGWYAYAPYYSEPYQDKVIYQRYSFAYRIADEITVGTTLRAHGLNSLNFNLMVRYNLQLSGEGN
jgi:hypothetical protein